MDVTIPRTGFASRRLPSARKKGGANRSAEARAIRRDMAAVDVVRAG